MVLRHQIAVLKRSGTRRPCFRLWDRLFWILLSWWWPRWPESLMIVQPETVKRWRRSGWSWLWRYPSGGRWRGERPRVSRKVRELIARMARENFLWVRRESTASCLCSGVTFPKQPYPDIWRPCTEVPGNCGGRLFAIRRSPLEIGTISSTPTNTGRAARTAPIAAISHALRDRLQD